MSNAEKILTSSEKFHINLGLSRTLSALEKLGNPHKFMDYIHVAGTNGKGSVCAMLNEILCTHFANSDVKIGLFTSPHLFSYAERMKINSKDIALNELDDYISRTIAVQEDLTEFEILTVAAFLYFREAGVRYAIFEVGLGGLYDSTNVIENPLCSVITTIDYDHISRLGNTIDEIAYQKAGIAKNGSKLVVARDNSGFNTIKKYAKECGANLVIADDNRDFDTALRGEHQKKNLSLVLACLDCLPFRISEETIKSALSNVQWKFRLEYHKEKNLLIDGAHNPSGIKCLRDYLDREFRDEKKTFIFGCLNNKDYENMLKTLVREEDEFYFYEFDYPNALKYEELPDSVKKFAKKTCDPHKIIEKHEGLCVVCGSLYMLGRLFNPR